jgi:Txe/YoeB family toxin of toxin-antitoxin system
MVSWEVVFTNQARKDAKKIAASNLRKKVEPLLEVLKNNPFSENPPYEKLVGDLEGAYSRRINIQHRLVYQVIKAKKIVKVIRMWTHYE